MVGALALLFIGYLMMVLAPNILLVLLSTMVRSCGSAVVWVYSTLLLQIRVPNQMLGRMMAAWSSVRSHHVAKIVLTGGVWILASHDQSK